MNARTYVNHTGNDIDRLGFRFNLREAPCEQSHNYIRLRYPRVSHSLRHRIVDLSELYSCQPEPDEFCRSPFAQWGRS